MAEVEKLRLDLATTQRELAKARENHEIERTRLENDNGTLRSQVGSLQASLTAMTEHRNREHRDRDSGVKEVDTLRAENGRLRKELATALDSRMSHLRTPQVSFDQYRELLSLCERYQAALAALGAGEAVQQPAGGADALKGARDWISGMGASPAAPTSTGGTSLLPEKQQQGHMQTLSTASSLQLDLSKVNGGGGPALGHSATHSELLPSTSMSPGGGGLASSRGGGGGGDGHLVQGHHQNGNGAAGASPGGSAGTDRPIRENVVEGGKLVKIIRDAAPNIGKLWSFHNTTIDTQFIVEFTFGPMCDITTLEAEKDGRIYRLSLFPGETKPFIRGLINGYKMSVKYGPPDESFVPPSATTDGDLSPSVSRAREILESCFGSVEAAITSPPAQQLGFLLEDGLPYIDIAFPPLSQSIARLNEQPDPPLYVKLLLPSSYLPTGQRPETLGKVISPGEVCSGKFTTQFFCSALRAVAEDKDLVLRMFSHCTSEESGSGLYHVWLNKRGLWEDVALDGYIPCDQQSDQPYGVHSRTQRALWPALVEKGLAKVNGSYAALQSASSGIKDGLEALQDLTGFPTERLDWKTKETTLFNNIHKGVGVQGNIVVLFTPRGENLAEGTELTIEGRRAESIGLELDSMNRIIATVNAEGFRLCLIRVPNISTSVHAYGPASTTGSSGPRWAGAWSEGSELWNRHPSVRESCDQARAPVPNDAGSDLIWMDWRDVGQYFEGAGVCYTRPTWVDYRLPVKFIGTKPSAMVELSVMKMTTLYIGVHQATRGGSTASAAGNTTALGLNATTLSGLNGGGFGSGDSDVDAASSVVGGGGVPSSDAAGGGDGGDGAGKYSAFLITVVGCSPNGVWDTVAQSRGGNFWRGRDVHLALTLRPSDHSYFVLVRRYSADGTKNVSLSLLCEHRDAVNVNVRAPSDAVMTSVRYSPVWKFDPEPCRVIPNFHAQVDRTLATLPLSQIQLQQIQANQRREIQASIAGGRGAGGGGGQSMDHRGHHRVATNMSMGSDIPPMGGGGPSGSRSFNYS